MASTIKDVTIEDVQDTFDSIIYLRGEEYFEEGLVRSIDIIDSTTLAGTVRGNQNYKVTITIDADGDISCECSCPCDFNCKHAAALLLHWLSIKDDSKEIKEAKPKKKESITDILNKKSKEELISLLTESLQKHPELKSLILIEKKEISKNIRNLFSEFVKWDEVNDLISQLETVLAGIKRNRGEWDRELLNELETCSRIMIKNQDNVHDEGDLGIFLEDWFLLFGEIFASIKPTQKEKIEFIKKIVELIQKDEYGMEGSFEKAFIGMCTTKEDIELIQQEYKPSETDETEDDNSYSELYLELYDKLGLNEKYLSIAKREGFSSSLIDKLISLGRLEEALAECGKCKKNDYFWDPESKKLEILKKLGRKDEYKKMLLSTVIKNLDINNALRLRKESTEPEWKRFRRQIISRAKTKGRDTFLSKMYYHESDFKNAYEYCKGMSDLNYLELLAKKLSTTHPQLACEIFKRLSFSWINSGSGWPYKKAGKMLEAIKILDKQGTLFNKTKNEIINKHKKKYSLRQIIEAI
ncbi:MAG: SWIM zinc finger family protein [Nanoarchaeota archaeon]